MEIRRWQIYFVINCVIVTHLAAKPVSLNELIAAEAKQKQTKQHPKTTGGKTISLNELIAAESKQNQKKVSVKPKEGDRRSGGESTTKPLSVKENYPAESRQKLLKPHFPKTLAKKPRRKSFSLKDLFASETRPAKRRIESLLSKTSGTFSAGLFSHRPSLFPALSRRPFESVEDLFSPLKFKKKFEIKSPLRPKKIKYSFGSRLKRRNQSSKREISDNEVFSHRIPLIKRLGLLMGDILSPAESSESTERIARRKQRRNRQKLSNNNKTGSDLASSESRPQKTAIAAPTTNSPTTTTDIISEATDTEDPTSEAPDTTTYNTTSSDVDTLRPDTDVSLPPARNTSGDRGNDIGVSQGSGTAFHRNVEGYFTRNNRSDEHHTRGTRNETYPSYNEEDSCSSTRLSKCHDGQWRSRHHNDTEAEEAETSNRFRRNDTERKDIFEIGSLQIPRNVRLRGPVPDKVVVVEAESVPPEEFSEKGYDSVPVNHTSAERGANRHGTTAAEDKRLRQVIEGVIPIQELINPDYLKQHGQKNPVVTIFDGYSVARDINGRNELTEKSIRISPN